MKSIAISASLLFLALSLSSQAGLSGTLSFLRLQKPDRLLPILGWSAAALVSSCLLTGALSGILWLAGLLDTLPVEQKMLSLPLPALISAFTLAPLAEEALFRGYFFRKMGGFSSKGNGWLAAAILSSLLFAAMHLAYGSFAELAVAFSIGALLCYFSRKSGSLWPAVLSHASFNFLSIFFTVVL